jgi:predicted short-subunit dehydrogenase-like oxidoreductase (DUF2520 family)
VTSRADADAADAAEAGPGGDARAGGDASPGGETGAGAVEVGAADSDAAGSGRPAEPDADADTDADADPDRPGIGIVGYGRVGAAFATALQRAGHRVVAIHTRSEQRRADARERFPGSLVATPGDVARAADVIFITVPDGVIASVADSLRRAGALRAGQVVVHASGRHGLASLAPVVRARAVRAAVHPIMTLPGGRDDASLLADAAFGVTSDAAAADLVDRLVADMGGRVVHVPDETRVLYHAALVIGANFAAALAGAAVGLLATAGVAEPAAVAAPLLRASLDNALAQGEIAMTGPVRRSDVETLDAHLAALRRDAPDLVDSYLVLSLLTVNRLERAGVVTPAAAASVRAALAPD